MTEREYVRAHKRVRNAMITCCYHGADTADLHLEFKETGVQCATWIET